MDYTDPIGNLIHLITDISYTPNSTMQSVRYGNGVVKNTTRDADHNYRLTRSTATLSGSTLLDTEYRYDAISNIDKIKENGIEPLRKSIDYTYDALARLTRADYVYSVAGYNRTNTPYSYTYDDIGNIVGASNIGSYGYSGLGYASPHAVTTAGDTTYAYDEAGQTSSRTSPGMILSFAYSPYGEMTSSVKNGETTTYAYDQSRRRILKSTLGLTEHHIIDGYEVEYESGAVVQVASMMSYELGMISSGTTNTGSTSSGSTSSGITLSGSTSSGVELPLDKGGSSSGAEAGGFGSGVTQTGSTSSGTTSSGTTNTGSTQTGSTDSGSTNSGSTNTGVTSSGTTQSGSTDSGSTNSGSTNSGSTSSGTYMIIAGYEASTMSGATPITLVTTLTHIMLGDERIATFQTQTDDSPKTADDDKLVYHIADHLNSSSLDLSSTGLVLQAVDYLPFGKSNTYEVTSKRIKGKKGGYTNKYQFANKQLDEESNLQYFEKRYYDNRIGRFTTEDPVYWEVALTKRPNQYFTDPQQWNSYSYVRNNPINLVDPTGEAAETGWDILNVAYDALVVAKNTVEVVVDGATNIYASATGNQALAQSSYQSQLQNYSELGNALIDTVADTAATAIPGVPAGGTKLAKVATEGAVKATGTKVISKSYDLKTVAGGRIDVENPGTRVGQIHFQSKSNTSQKFILNTSTNTFHIGRTTGTMAPRAIQNLLKNKEVQKAISKAKTILGIN